MKNKVVLLLTLILVSFSCENHIEITRGINEFNVTTEKTSYKVGEEITFLFEGNPDLISFYSGEELHQYVYKEGRTIQMDSVNFSFSTYNGSGAASSCTLNILLSTDFNGKYDYENVSKATWKDISHFYLLPLTIYGRYIDSGAYNVKEQIGKDESPYFYLAFKLNNPAGSFGRYYFNNISVRGVDSDGKVVPFAVTNTYGVEIIEKDPASPSNSAIASTQYAYRIHTDTIETEAWFVSKIFNSGNIDLGPDRPIAIKGYESGKTVAFNYTYEKPGIYNICFVAKNVTINDEKQVIKEMTIEITE